MNIVNDKIDELNSILKIKIEKEDYEERVNTVLNDYRKKAKLDGFRPGKVPFGLIRKMYRKPVLVEEVTKVLNESLVNYIKKENLNILGEPLPNKENETDIDWDNDEEYNFAFDIAVSPEFDIEISQKDKIPFYNIKIDDKLRTKYIENYKARLGTHKEIDIVDENSTIKASLVQIDETGNEVEDGIKVDEGSLSINLIQDDNIKSSFLKRKTGDSFSVNLKKAYPNDVDLSSLLKIKKEEVDLIKGDFKVTINSISIFELAEENQEFYDKLFGEGNVKSPEEFKEELNNIIEQDLKNDSEYKFQQDVKQYYTKKFKKDLPEDFLKRWILSTNKEKITEEKLDEEFENYREDIKWQLITGKFSTDNDIKVNEEEIIDYVKQFARMQFAQYYGMANIPDEHLDNYVHELLKKEEEKRRFHERILEQKIIETVKQNVKIDNKEVSSEKFNKLLEK